ncbi:MAG: PLP-dependent transferase [Kosmotoga sp.]|nr:MAG: PLP-dependent transferase [Kosmotoga sp.]
MNKNEEFNFDTLAIHAGEEEDQHQALNNPVYLTSTFTFRDIKQAQDTFDFKRKAYVYTRGGNPTVNLLERRMAALEKGIDSVAFSSGMAAITTVILSLSKNDDEIIAHRNLYGSTFSALDKLLPNYGIKTIFTDMTDIEEVKDLITDKTRVIFFETPTNPSMEIIDIGAIVELARKYNISVVVDNTFATPYFQKPLEYGVDVVVHSATKYISGHGDVVAGIAISKDQEYIHRLKFGFMCELGGVMSPFDAWLLLRGLKTLHLRMERHNSNALELTNYLKNNTKVERVLHPSLKNHPGHSTAQKQMSGFGGIVSFELKGDLDTAKAFIKKLKMLKLAVSLGDAETLVEIPALMTHRDYPEDKLHEFGFKKKTIRISTGLENPLDIISDVKQAIEGV